MKAAEPFAASGKFSDLLSLHEGSNVGQWRDSQEGLGGGRYPYDVNAVLVPAALRDVAVLCDEQLADPKRAELARTQAKAWQGARKLFEVTVNAQTLRQRSSAYLTSLGLDASDLAKKVPQRLRFPGLALDEAGRPIPIIHSDEAFELAFGNPTQTEVKEILERAMQSFPFGLSSDAGLLVAVPTLAEPSVAKTFSPRHYHGAVSWSWHYALYDLGIERQKKRFDAKLPVLGQADEWMDDLMERMSSWLDNELWSWQPTADKRSIQAVPFGQIGAHTESNLLQAWSTASAMRRQRRQRK